MSLSSIIKKYTLPITLGLGLFMVSCGPSPDAAGRFDAEAQATTEAGGEAIFGSELTFFTGPSASLIPKLETEKQSGTYNIVRVDYPSLLLEETFEEGATYDINITRIVAIQSGFTDVENYETFLYLGNRPLIEGTKVRLEYFPVKEGQLITEDDITDFMFSSSYGLNRVIEGFHGPYSITGIIAIENGLPAIEYISPGE
ncbi:TPA: hypothetical protein HA239_00400 [Candidatus Woesearchaeota archaeon]|nr:hypothetical protein QT06_C0001G0160 [archaeon GW2011_AR15]MBS3104037.1 hypothetical protein [Candidatus Woesearchaeota archaeon]HIH40859.1 hypothetical protein [Candidatus Woesearchaeota archaeon]